MTTIRRIYVFVVCFVSLQWAAASFKPLLDALLRWLLTGQTSDLRSAVFPLAVVIAGTPVFLGHWLWAEWSARRDPTERRCLERHLYLYLTLGLLTIYLALAIHSGVEALFQVLLPTSLTQIDSRAIPLAAFISSFPSVAALGALWGYHRFVIAQDEKAESRPPAERPAGIKFFGNLGFVSVGMALMAYGVFQILYELLSLPDQHTLLSLPAAAGALAAGGALWPTHQRMLARDPSASASFKVIMRWLYAHLFIFVGWALAIGGLVSAQQWLFARWNNSAETTLPAGLAALIAGLPLLTYHEWTLRRAAPGSGLKACRQLYAAGANLAGLVMVIVGAINGFHWLFGLNVDWRVPIPDMAAWLIPGLLTWAYYEFELYPVDKSLRWWHALALSLLGLYLAGTGAVYLQVWLMGRLSAPDATLASALGWLLTGFPVLIYYERLVYRYQPQGKALARWFTAWAVQGFGVLMTTAGMVQSLRWLFDLLGGERPVAPFGAPWLLAGALMWAYYRRVMAHSESDQPFLTRLSLFGFSGLGVSLTTIGLIGVQEWLFSRFVGEPMLRLPDSLAALITGLPLWLYFWRWASRLFASGQPAEQKSDLRKAYLYVIIYMGVNGAVITIGLLLNGILRQVLGLPTTGSLALPLSIMIASVALWAYHAYGLRSDIRRAGETSLQGGMQRLYWYLVAGVGLLAFALGLAGTLSSVLRLIASLWEGNGVTVELREQLAGSLASLLAGLPVWASAWFPAQHAATVPGGAEMRRSLLRKAYLYFYLLAAILAALVFSVTIVFQLLNALFGLFRGDNLLADLGQSIGFALIGSALWIYHGWVLRGDGRFAKQEKEQVAQQVTAQQAQALSQLKARWAGFRVVVVDPGSGKFGHTVIHELRREWPHLNVVGMGLTLEARAVLQSESLLAPDTEPSAMQDEAAQLVDASLVVAPWTAASPGSIVARSKATKLIVPVAVEGMQWVGVPPTAATAPSVIQAVRQILQAQAVASRGG